MRDVAGAEHARGDHPGAPTAPSHYRPQLDGMRAVAVYLVVAFHAGISAFSGGFIGVDVFFVLSGYLVTQLLLRDFSAAGRIDFRRFYSRRFRRLLPAAFVVLIVTGTVYAAVATPADVAAALGGFRAAFLYVANWHFIAQSNDYFAADVNTNPVVHFWSLSVEEQFYLAWPLLFSGAYLVARRAGARQWKVVRLIIAAGFVLSLALALHLSTVNLSRAYYGTDARAYELLAGALLAMTPRLFREAKRRRRTVQALAPLNLAVLVLIALSVVHLGAIQRGVAATAATCGLIVALEVSQGGVVRRVLSRPTTVYLGRVSYGTYLWHWPVIVIATQRFDPNPVSLFALSCLIATGLASLSFTILEQPVRLSRVLDQRRSAVIAVGLVTSVVGGLLIVPYILRHERGAAGTSTAVLGNGGSGADLRVPVPANLDLQAAGAAPFGNASCYGAPAENCILVNGKGPRVLLVGDSHALGLIPAFTAMARRQGLSLAVASLPNCPWPEGLVEAPPAAPTNLPETCRAHQADWYDRVVPALDPDVVVLLHQPFDDPGAPPTLRAPNGALVHLGTPGFDGAVGRAADATVAKLRKPGRKVVVLEPLPIAPGGFNPFSCLSQAKHLEDCRYVATAAPTALERRYRAAANGTDVFAFNLDRLVCPYLPICDPIVGGVVVKKDPQHITAGYSKKLADPIAALFAANRVIPKSP